MPAKTADQWFSEYGESHHNALNKSLHWICVPTIAACVIAFLWELPTPAFMHPIPFLNWGTIAVAAGHGSGGRKYDVIPGKPDESILLFRMESEDPSIMMPNVGRRLVPAEAVELVQEWIEKMPPSE